MGEEKESTHLGESLVYKTWILGGYDPVKPRTDE